MNTLINQYFELHKSKENSLNKRDEYLKTKELIKFTTKNKLKTITERNRKTIVVGNKVIGEIKTQVENGSRNNIYKTI